MTKLFICTLLGSVMLAAAPAIFAQTAGAPRIYDVEFINGIYKSTGTVSPFRGCPPTAPQGVCGNSNSRGYSLTGRAGDLITITVTSRTGGAIFSIFTPDGDLLKGGSAVTSWKGKLPADGYYRINVYTNRSYTPFKIIFTRSH